MSTFHGLEMARRALSAQQSGLYTTGHNISNANTDGYSRQRVNFNTSTPYPAVGKNRPNIPGQKGTGVDVGSIERVRDLFLDKQYRSENSRAGFWDSTADALSRMEELLNEPSESGLSHTIDEFWDSLEELSVNPDSDGAHSVVAQRGLAVAETFNHLSESLHSIQADLHKEIDTSVGDVNSLLSQINDLNNQVKKIEPHGDLANDLYDERDQLLDELSEMMNIKVTYDNAGGNAQEIAQGIASIEFVDSEGASLDPSVQLLDGSVDYQDGYFDNFMTLSTDEDTGSITDIQFNNESLSAENFVDQSKGKLSGLIKSLGYGDGEEVKGDNPDMIADLDKMAQAMADEFNKVHRLGDDEEENELYLDFFSYDTDSDSDYEGAASTITVAQHILDDPSLINASTLDEDGEETENGENALNLAKVFSDPLDDLEGDSVNSFFDQMIGEMGVQAQEANRMARNTGTLRSQIEEQQMSVSSVSLDEEMSNMLQFQHAYNASARSMTAIDELLDTIINGMGLVGR